MRKTKKKGPIEKKPQNEKGGNWRPTGLARIGSKYSPRSSTPTQYQGKIRSREEILQVRRLRGKQKKRQERKRITSKKTTQKGKRGGKGTPSPNHS